MRVSNISNSKYTLAASIAEMTVGGPKGLLMHDRRDRPHDRPRSPAASCSPPARRQAASFITDTNIVIDGALTGRPVLVTLGVRHLALLYRSAQSAIGSKRFQVDLIRHFEENAIRITKPATTPLTKWRVQQHDACIS